MIQVSVSIREDKHALLAAWADERDDTMANICRGWIYSGLADLKQALDRFEIAPHPQDYQQPQEVLQHEQPEQNPEQERPPQQHIQPPV